MTDDAKSDDAQQLAALGKDLPAIDVDTISAERIAMRARADIGKGPSPRRLVLPIAGGLLVLAYLVWMVAKLVEILR